MSRKSGLNTSFNHPLRVGAAKAPRIETQQLHEIIKSFPIFSQRFKSNVSAPGFPGAHRSRLNPIYGSTKFHEGNAGTKSRGRCGSE